MKSFLCTAAALLLAFGAAAQDAPESPDVNQVIEDMAAVGPDALLSRVKELKQSEQALKAEADALREQAAQKEAEAEAMRARIQAVEQFTNELATAMSPPPPPAPQVEQPVVAAPSEPETPEAPAAPAEPAVEAPEMPEPTQVSAEPPPAEESMGMDGGENQM